MRNTSFASPDDPQATQEIHLPRLEAGFQHPHADQRQQYRATPAPQFHALDQGPADIVPPEQPLAALRDFRGQFTAPRKPPDQSRRHAEDSRHVRRGQPHPARWLC